MAMSPGIVAEQSPTLSTVSIMPGMDLRAPERTTEEFLGELRGTGRLSDLQQSLLGDFLTRCDLVKFARHEPSEPELRALHDAAVRLVEETEPLLNPQASPPTVPPVAAPVAAR